MPVPATITDSAIDPLGRDDAAMSGHTLRWRYVFEGRAYEDHQLAQDRLRLGPTDQRRVGDLRPGDSLTVWIDPRHPGSAALREDRLLGNEPGQWLLGGALLLAGVAVAVVAVARPRRAKAAAP